jgi:hypothetical protein
MKELAAQERVLQIRVQSNDLPEQYSLRIREVESSECFYGAVSASNGVF